jgi:8-oxo-dGTP pyrophosphatase MutT (NUDIX family)
LADNAAFPELMRDRLCGRLPGRDAQAKMSPRGRPGKTDIKDFPCREAAVLALLHQTAAGPAVVLIERPAHLRKHPGQIAFPGGRREEGETRLQAAVRETHEEVGVPEDRFEVLGALTPLYIPPSGFCVFPFVGWATDLPEFVLDPGEVAAAFSAPLAAFVDGPRDLIDIPKLERMVPAFLFEGRRVWGATAMMLSELAELSEALLP